MNQIKLFIELTRIKRPIGFMLLFWPCLWGLTLAYDFNLGVFTYFFYSTLFLSGSILMRSAGCIVNDIADKNFDRKVERTKNRPIASGKVSVKLASVYALFLCGVAFLVLINFNYFTILMALISMPLAFTYPLMKRITYWPQLFLGITFNYGLLLGWTSINESLSMLPILFYIGAIFWTLGYDTIYAHQDKEDDLRIGVKSTARLFQSNTKKWLWFFLIISIVFMTLAFTTALKSENNIFCFIIGITGILAFGIHLIWQLINLDINNADNCLMIFRSNRNAGLLPVLGFTCAIILQSIILTS